MSEVEFELSAVMAELKAIRRELERIQRRESSWAKETHYQRIRARHHLEVKRAMHQTLDALYRKTKAERDAALARLAALKEDS